MVESALPFLDYQRLPPLPLLPITLTPSLTCSVLPGGAVNAFEQGSKLEGLNYPCSFTDTPLTLCGIQCPTNPLAMLAHLIP